MAENTEGPSLPQAVSRIPNSSRPDSEGDGLLGLAVMAAMVAIPPLVGYIVGKINSIKDEPAPKIKNARPIASKPPKYPPYQLSFCKMPAGIFQRRTVAARSIKLLS